MITGHIGIAFGARALDRREPGMRAPLLWLLAASVAPDGLDGLYTLGHYCNPDAAFSHSLPAVGILATLMAIAAFLHTRSVLTALMVGGMVIMHLPPDYITGRKALWPGGPVIGLFVYRWGWLDFLIEVPVLVTGWWMLRRSGFTPRWVVSGFVLAALLAVQAGFNVTSVVYGPAVRPVCTR
jgi:hypothetical protein